MLDSSSKFYLIVMLALGLVSCSTGQTAGETTNIENPFGNYNANGAGDASNNITLRSKKGDRAFEVSLPQDQNSELQVPMNGKFASSETPLTTRVDGVDYQYMKQKPTAADREIASTFSNSEDSVADAKKREIEASLGLQASDEMPNMDESYLARVDVAKQLFHSGRFEAALIEIDHMIKDYPTNGRLYEMRGTLLDRLGYGSLAIRSWKQALEFEPGRLSLKKMIEKKEQQRSVASENGKRK